MVPGDHHPRDGRMRRLRMEDTAVRSARTAGNGGVQGLEGCGVTGLGVKRSNKNPQSRSSDCVTLNPNDQLPGAQRKGDA